MRVRARTVSVATPIAAVAAALLLSASLACTSTVVDRSAQPRDPEHTWEERVERAARFHRQGLLEAAEHQYGLALDASRRFGNGDPRIATTLTQRAELRLARGNYAGAEGDYREAIAVERVDPRDRGARLANALNNLAVFYSDLERFEQAARLLSEAIEIRTALYGRDHPYVAVLLQNLGDAARRAQSYEGAEALLRRALTIYTSAGRDFEREASVALNSLALVYGATDREQRAERAHLDAIRLSIDANGERNPDVGVFTRDLAELYARQRRFAEAEPLYRGSISILRDRLGPASYQLSKTYRAYAEMLDAQGRDREAAEYRERADATGY